MRETHMQTRVVNKTIHMFRDTDAQVHICTPHTRIHTHTRNHTDTDAQEGTCEHATAHTYTHTHQYSGTHTLTHMHTAAQGFLCISFPFNLIVTGSRYKSPRPYIFSAGSLQYEVSHGQIKPNIACSMYNYWLLLAKVLFSRGLDPEGYEPLTIMTVLVGCSIH